MPEPQKHSRPSAHEALVLLDRYVSGEIAVEDLLAPVDDWDEIVGRGYSGDDESDLAEDLIAVYTAYLHIKVYDRYFGQLDESSLRDELLNEWQPHLAAGEEEWRHKVQTGWWPFSDQ